MTESADKDANTSAVAPKSPPAKPKLTNRGAALIALTVFGGAAAVGLFALVGPLAAAAVPVAAAGAGYAHHRTKNTKRSTGRQKKGWSLTWGKSGGQSRRALSRLGIGSKKSAGAGSGRTGAKSPSSSSSRKSGLTPRKALAGFRSGTTRSRAASGAGGVLPKHKGRRSVPPRTTARSAPFVGARPRGAQPPKTASKTAARPATSPRLTGPKRAGSTSRKGSTPGPASTSRRPNLRLLQGGRSSGAGRSGLPLSTRKASPSAHRKTSPKGSSPLRRLRQINPLTRTSPSGRHSRLKSPFRRTGRSSIGNPRKPISRDRVPHRTAKRPVPYKRTKARALWRMALGIPSRKGNKLERISAAKRARARRTLRLRALTRLFAVRRFPGFLSRLPARFGRWHWDRIWSRVPVAPKPEHEWLTAAPRPKPPVPPLTFVQPVAVATSPTREVTTAMPSTPQQMIIEAFNTLALYQPEDASEMERHLAADHEMWQQIASSLQIWSGRVTLEMPYGPATADSIGDMGAAAASIGQLAQQVHATFRSEHEIELNRLENPRAREGDWNTPK